MSKEVDRMIEELAIGKVKDKIMKDNQANHTGSVFMLTEEEAEAKVTNDEIEEAKKSITNVSLVEGLITQLQDYKSKVDKLDDAKESEIYLINDKFNQEAISEEKELIIEKYRDKKRELKASVKATIDNVGEYLQNQLDKKTIAGDTTSEAINDIKLLGLLETIGKAELEIIANRHKDQPLVIRALSDIGKQHGLYIRDSSEDGVADFPSIVKDRCTSFVDQYSEGDNSYTSRMLTTEDKGNWLLAMVNKINDSLLEDIEVLESYSK